MRLIDADAFSRTIGILADKMDRSGQIVCEQLQAILGCYECEDAVAVVRCKNCKHYGFTDNRVPEEQVWWCYKWSREMKENDFCSYGEKKHETDRRRRTIRKNEKD